MSIKVSESKTAIWQQAQEALKSLLAQVSSIRLIELSDRLPAERSKIRFAAHVDVLGHLYSLVCEVKASGLTLNLRDALAELRRAAAQYRANAIPMLIAPYLTLEAQAICKECGIGFLELEGSARITLGQVFIGRRKLTQRNVALQSSFNSVGLNRPLGLVLSSEHSRPAHPPATAAAVA